MCLIFVAVEAHPKYRLIIAANRDEFYDRPSAPASFWSDAPWLLAGRDLRAGGTWLGVTRNGRFAALTNYRDPESNRVTAPSRGHLVSDFLLGAMESADYLAHLCPNAHQYNGFNLLAGQGADLHCYSSSTGEIQSLEPGIHGLSNHLMDTPWPKVKKGKQSLQLLLAEKDVCPEDLFRLLHDNEAAPDESLPDTGVGLALERMLSPVFINSPDYGTRSSTVLLMEQSGRVTFVEKSFRDGSGPPSTVEFSFMSGIDLP